MSIRQECIDHVREGRLYRLGFLVPGRPEKRTVLMSQEINDLVSGPWSSDLMEDRCYRLRANLETILAGDLLNVCWGPYKGKPHHHIGRLDKPGEEVWDIRSVDPPGLRTLFRFAEQDVLVAFTCSPRSVPLTWLYRMPLVERKDWKRAKTECKRQWGILFPADEPHKKGRISVTTSQTPFLSELMAGHSGPPIPAGKRAYFQERLRIRVFNFLLSKFIQAQKKGLNKNVLAKRIDRPPEVVNRWLGAPSNLTLDTISDLLLGISAEELELDASSPIGRVADNYSHFDELASLAQSASAMANADLTLTQSDNDNHFARIKAQENAYSAQSEGQTLG